MTPTPAQTTFLHTLKGAPLAILTLMLFCPPPPQGYTNQQLGRYTNYSGKTIADALWLLQQHNAITQTPSGRWLPPRDYGQLPLFQHAPGIASGAPPQIVSGIASDTEIEPGTASGQHPTRKNSVIEGDQDGNFPSPPPYLFNYSSSPEKEEINKKTNTPPKRKNSVIHQLTQTEPTATMWRLLKKAGVGAYSPKMAEILQDERIDEDAVCWHCYTATKRPYPVNHIIHNLTHGQNPPHIPWGEHLPFMAEHFPDLAAELRPQATAATSPASRYIPSSLADLITH
jgi:hypothetical protein